MTVKTSASNIRPVPRTLRKQLAALTSVWSAAVNVPPEARMAYWLGQVARQVREQAGLIRAEVAGKVPCDQTVLSNFERGRSVPHNLDRVLNTYAELGGLDNGRDIWKLALELWERDERENGRNPNSRGSAKRTARRARR